MANPFVAHAEFCIFAAVSVVAFGFQGLWLRRTRAAELPWLVWVLAGTLTCATWHVAVQAGSLERERIQGFTQDFARLYGSEIEKCGHWRLKSDAEPNDPLYLELIETEKRWLGLNSFIHDIYTLRKGPDGRNIFVVDSETDYDRDGKYEGDREERTKAGEVFDAIDPWLEEAFRGKATFNVEPVTDRWGTWVSAYVPLHSPDGGVEAVLGVDFEARIFTRTIAVAEGRVINLMAVAQLVLLAASTLTSILHADIRERERAAAELARAQKAMIAVSRRAGMAEVATSVLHNVGNVLNSVNVAANCVADGVRRTKLRSLDRAVTLLREHREALPDFFRQDPRGASLPDFLARLSGQLAHEHSATLTEVARLQKNIEHIKDIVAAQQNHGRIAGITEKLDMADLVDDTLRLSADLLAQHHVEVICEFTPVPPVTVDRHKVLQILVNLVSNAKHACQAADRPDRTLTVRIFSGEGVVNIAVADNGVGIPPENLVRIFHHGFTTKPAGHGYGLHSSAVAAQEMGGTLRVESKGTGEGATFTLALPATATLEKHV